MSIIFYILLFTFIGSIASLIGGLFLLLNEKLCKKLVPFFIAFAAGSLITVALIDLIPEALEESASRPRSIFLTVLAGLVVFFLLERYIFWHHCHSDHKHKQQLGSTSTLIIIGDTVHNFIDGIAIAASFMVSISVGIATSIAVGLHEIPQEIGDFGVLLALGLKRQRVFLINLISAFSAFLGALLTFYFLSTAKTILPYLLAFTGGHFIYIAASDLIPQIHTKSKSKEEYNQTLAFLLGIVITYFAISLLH